MHRAILLLFLVPVARAEYLPGFSLYRHTADADSILELDLPEEGPARLVATLLGPWEGAPLPTLGPEDLRERPKGTTRAIVFLREGEPILEGVGVAWLAKEAVPLMPDNWGYGVCYPVDYRDPTPDEFRKSVRTAIADREEVARIGGMRLGAERALAASRLLAKERPEVSWYVFFGRALVWQFNLKEETPRPETGTYICELRLALAAALGELTVEEKRALREQVASLPPGAVRREHVELLARTDAFASAFALLKSCHEAAADIEEWATTAHALWHADAKQAAPLLLAEASLGKPGQSRRLLDVLDASDAAALDVAARLGRGLLDTKTAPADAKGLDYGICAFLTAGKRPADRELLLAMARSELPCRGQALGHLRTWTGKDWDAGDARWDEHLRVP